MDETRRTPKWRRNVELERLLGQLESYTEAIELPQCEVSPRIGLICGAPRSGTSVILQSLASTGLIAYPSNMISRFYAAPYLGAMAQKLFTNEQMDTLGEFEDLRSGLQSESFHSDLGKTRGALGVNEFWYFWRRFFSIEDGETLSRVDFENERTERFLNELAAWQSVDMRPIVMKGLIANWNLCALSEVLDNAHIVIVRRDPIENAISLLRAREAFFSDRKVWYSFKIPEVCRLPTSNPLEEVALQIACHDVLLDEQCRLMLKDRYSVVTLEEFREDPTETLSGLLSAILGTNGGSFPRIETEPEIRPSARGINLLESEIAEIRIKYEKFCATLIPVAKTLYEHHTA